jgi:hypothetical protein
MKKQLLLGLLMAATSFSAQAARILTPVLLANAIGYQAGHETGSRDFKSTQYNQSFHKASAYKA